MTAKWDQWYEKNKAALNERRRQKYATDPEYRKKARGVSRPKDVGPKALPDVPPPKQWGQMVVYTEDGAPMTVFSVAALEAATHASQQALRNWEVRGLILPADHHAPNGARYYTMATIEKIRTQILDAGLVVRSRRNEVGKYPVRFSDGREEVVTLYPVSDLAVALQRRVSSVEILEREGVVPETPFRLTSRRRRYYTLEMVQSARKALEEAMAATKDTSGVFRAGSPFTAYFKTQLHAAWAPMMGAEVIRL